MTSELEFQDQIEQYFLVEASELLQTIEQTLLSLLEEKNTEKVHTLMRSAHTLKGSAANCELETIKTIAHHLEDVFQALYPPELDIDPELGSLLLEGYECLRTPLTAILTNLPYDETAILDRTAAVFAQLQTSLGDFFGREAPLPTSEELGFDVVGLIFADSIPQDLQQLEEAIASQDQQQVETVLRSEAEFFAELGASYSLPGLEEIAQTTLSAMNQHPNSAIQIAQVALENFQQAHAMVLAGDRTLGGEVSSELRHWMELNSSVVSVEAGGGRGAEGPRGRGALEMGESPLLTPLTHYAGEVGEEISNVFTVPAFLEDLEYDVPELDEFLTEELEVTQLETPTLESSSIVPSSPPTSPSSPASIAGEEFSATSAIDLILQSVWAGNLETTLRSQNSQSAGKNSSAAPLSKNQTHSAAALPSIRVAIELLDRLSHAIGELLINENQQNLQSDRVHHLAQDTFGQFLRCQQQLSQIRDWSDNNLLLLDRPRRQSYKGTSFRKSTKSAALSLLGIPSKFDELEMDVYSDLHLLLQNLTENMMQLGERIEALEGVAQQFRLNLGKRKQLLSSTQEELLQARMVPLGTVLNRLPRLLQQMVAAHYKPAELKLSGTAVLVDKAIAEKLYDPLLHLLRNAYDHGLESTDVRRQQGKLETGQIAVHAYHQGNRTTIEIRDDGQGLNWVRIRQKAIDTHLLTPIQAASASEAELAEVLFEPGFSTTEKISELSGRGIGLDVVRSQLQALQGSISVRSVSGQGTTFALQLPLTLTTARLLICESQGVIYALLSEAISQVLLPQPDRIHSQQSITGQGMQTFLRWEEGANQQLVPIHCLNDLLSYQYPLFAHDRSGTLSLFPVKPKNTVNPLLMLQAYDQHLCLQVNQILVEQELVIKSLGNTLILPSYIQGYSVLGDGSLTLVIDPIELVSQAGKTSLIDSFPASKLLDRSHPALKPASTVETQLILTPVVQDSQTVDIGSGNNQPSRSGQRLQVLVVDDSVVQRQSLVLTLKKVGYQVLQAGNGQEAIAQLNQHPEVHLVICDIEMPYMNGYEFLSHCRQDTRFSQIPVIMLTTRSGQKHRQLALALGAKEYFTKPYSDQGLLETISQLVNQPQLLSASSMET